MSAELVVAWKELLPIGDLVWQQAFIDVVEELQKDLPVRTQGLGDDGASVYFLAYLASDQADIEDDAVLSRVLGTIPDPPHTSVALLACAACSPQIKPPRVRSLLIKQGQAGIANATSHRVLTQPDVADVTRLVIELETKKLRLSGVDVGSPFPSSFSSRLAMEAEDF